MSITVNMKPKVWQLDQKCWEFSMFGSRQKKTMPIEEEAVWNGWNKSTLVSVTGKDRLIFQINSLSVTNWFDAEEYASGASLAESELDAYNKMPLLFEDRPTGIGKENYHRVEASVTGLETSLNVRSEIAIVKTSLSEISAEKRAGWLCLNGQHTGMDGFGKETLVPLISASLYDPNGAVLESIRKSFFDSQNHKKSPKMRFFLREKIQTDIEDSKKHRSYAINKFIIWETWGHDEPV